MDHVFKRMFIHSKYELWQLITGDDLFYNVKHKPQPLRDGGLFIYHLARNRWYFLDIDSARFTNLQRYHRVIRHILTKLREDNLTNQM